MLFLFNTTVLDLGDPAGRLEASGCPINGAALRKLTLAQISAAARAAILARPDLPTAAPDKAAGLAALYALKADANALLAFAPPGAKHEQDVVVRLASVSLITLLQLARMAEGGPLSPRTVNASVWAVAA